MKDNFDANAGPVRKRDENAPAAPELETRYYSAPNGRHRSHSANGHAPASKVDFWVFLDLLARRWYWLLFGGLAGAGLLFLAGFYLIQPKFTARAQLLRYETPGASDFFKTTSPMSADTFSGLIRAPDLLRRVGELASPPLPPEKLAKRLKVDPEPDSDMVNVLLVANQPQAAVDLLNLYLQSAVAFTRELQGQEAGVVVNNYLKRQVGQMDLDIQALHEQFRGLPLTPELAGMTNKLAEVGTNLNALSRNLAVPARPSALLGMQAEHLNKALGELSELMSKYKEIHPLVQQKQAEIDSLKNQISRESTNQSPASAMMTGGAAGFGATGTQPWFNPDFDIIQIKLRSLEDGRVQLANRLHEAELYATDPPGSVRIFAPATLQTVQPNWRWLKVGLMTCFGFCLGLGGSIMLLMLVEFTDNHLKTPDDLNRVTRLPVLGELGDLQRMSAEARSLWAFRTWTMLQGRLSPSANHGLVCGITSSEHGEGRSTWLNLLAEAASLTGFRVLTIATRPSPGHVEFLEERSETAAPERAATNGSSHPSTTLTSNVLSMPAQVTDQLTGPNSQPMVHIPLPGWVWNLERRKQWREALNHWRQIENLVILVELPPASVAEAVLLGSNLPNMLWLASSGTAQATKTRDQLETLSDARCNLVGAVLNRQAATPLKKRFPRWLG